ncbi:hypothetical protein JOC25_001348 [Solibacillus kalamii]|nr:hypothetical protein [Solibacillus kalamii]
MDIVKHIEGSFHNETGFLYDKHKNDMKNIQFI